jgi:hypothetical protein
MNVRSEFHGKQFLAYLLKYGLISIGGLFVVILLQIAIHKNDGILLFFLRDKEPAILSFKAGSKYWIAVIWAPALETSWMALLIYLLKFINSNKSIICFVCAIFWGFIHGITGYSLILPMGWFFFWLTMSVLCWEGKRMYAYLPQWIIHVVYNNLVFFVL